MELEQFLTQAIDLPGLSGHELPVAQFVAQAFRPYSHRVEIDAMQNVIAHLPGEGGGPTIMLTAHIDEIGLMVTFIEADGCLRFTQVGGVDSRILPGSTVTLLTDPPLMGVIGAKPPHLLSAADREKNYKREDLYIDIGYPPEKVQELVAIGTPVQLSGPFLPLEGDRACGKTFDDRACVGMLLLAARQLSTMRHQAHVVIVAATQEEVGSRGATTACYALDPDIAIAVDVTHGSMPGCQPDETYPLDKVVMTWGPNIHPKLFDQIQAVAKAQRVEVLTSVCPHPTWTDASELQISRTGVPTALVELPLKYMHTTVELCQLSTLREGARLLAAYCAGVGSDWEEALCY